MSIAAHRSDSAFWLETGRQFTLATFGDVGQLLQSCRDARDALPRLCQYYAIVGCGSALEFVLDPDGASIYLNRTCDSGVEAKLKTELIVGAFARNTGVLSGEDLSFLSFEFDYPEPSDADSYRASLGPRISFGHARCRITIPTDPLDRPNTLANRTMRSALSKRCQAALLRVQTEGIEDRVREVIVQTPGLAPTLPQVASRLGSSTRTLSRQLSQGGFRFDVIRRDVQYNRARELLRETTMSVAEVASGVGFDNASNFARAFVRWSGATPSQFRTS
ncbi:MAG: AraC family transcriptional regulator ligand-binding domain-containing protein [Nannocystaceae bacterium]|nr:AraC family transcriptional regulator ligand-binding domain-containing protein [Nannocystaceae bacterium]